MLGKLNGNAYPKGVPQNVWVFLQQRNKRERFLESKLEQKSNEILRAKSVRGSEWESWSVSETHPPLGLYLKSMDIKRSGKGRAQRLVTIGLGWSPDNVQMGLAEPRVWATPASPTCWQVWPTAPQRLPWVVPGVLWSNLLREDVQINFSKDTNA
jgi:hypothetical protein